MSHRLFTSALTSALVKSWISADPSCNPSARRARPKPKKKSKPILPSEAILDSGPERVLAAKHFLLQDMHEIVAFFEYKSKRLINGAVFQIPDLKSLESVRPINRFMNPR